MEALCVDGSRYSPRNEVNRANCGGKLPRAANCGGKLSRAANCGGELSCVANCGGELCRAWACCSAGLVYVNNTDALNSLSYEIRMNCSNKNSLIHLGSSIMNKDLVDVASFTNIPEYFSSLKF